MLRKVRSTLVNRQFLKLNLVLVVLLLIGAMSASAQDSITSSPTVASQAWFPGLSISDSFAESDGRLPCAWNGPGAAETNQHSGSATSTAKAQA